MKQPLRDVLPSPIQMLDDLLIEQTNTACACGVQSDNPLVSNTMTDSRFEISFECECGAVRTVVVLKSCAACNSLIISTFDEDAEALTEANQIWGEHAEFQPVCDDCYEDVITAAAEGTA